MAPCECIQYSFDNFPYDSLAYFLIRANSPGVDVSTYPLIASEAPCIDNNVIIDAEIQAKSRAINYIMRYTVKLDDNIIKEIAKISKITEKTNFSTDALTYKRISFDASLSVNTPYIISVTKNWLHIQEPFSGLIKEIATDDIISGKLSITCFYDKKQTSLHYGETPFTYIGPKIQEQIKIIDSIINITKGDQTNLMTAIKNSVSSLWYYRNLIVYAMVIRPQNINMLAHLWNQIKPFGSFRANLEIPFVLHHLNEYLNDKEPITSDKIDNMENFFQQLSIEAFIKNDNLEEIRKIGQINWNTVVDISETPLFFVNYQSEATYLQIAAFLEL